MCMHRIARLLSDIHAVLDRIEVPELLLHQAVRGMEDGGPPVAWVVQGNAILARGTFGKIESQGSPQPKNWLFASRQIERIWQKS